MRMRAVTTMLMTAVLMMALGGSVSYGAKSDADKMRELQKKMDALEQKKANLAAKAQQDMERNKPTGKNLEEIIVRWEKLMEDCRAGMKSLRCADALYNLGSLYYDRSRDEYIKKREAYEKTMDEYERTGKGEEPLNPVPDYSKSLVTYEELAKDYPDFSKVAEAYYQMGNIYMLTGDIDKCNAAYKKIIDEFPSSPRTSMVHFKLADLAYLDQRQSEALSHLEKVKEGDVDVQTWEMVHYRKAELYYNTGEFEKAVDLFYTYVERCDAGTFKKRQFRDEALEFIAICFSDMANGPDEAVKFFRRVGKKPYEAQVMYTIGMKNRVHGQWEDAIKSLSTALSRFPYYKSAPLARQSLIECYVVKKQYEKANAERERLVDDYGPSSAWYAKNAGEKAVIDQARDEVKRALGSIAIYYHAIAQKKKDKSAYENALRRYEEFMRKFAEDRWRVYEFKYNSAEIHSALGDCGKAAENYDYVAMADLSTFPEYKREIDTLGMDQTELEKLKRKAEKGKGPVLISQEDAGYNVIVARDKCRKKAIAAGGLSDEQAYELPETKEILSYAERFVARFPESKNAPEVLYLAGNIYYGAKAYEESIRLFGQIGEQYAKSAVAGKAIRMLANSYVNAGRYEQAMDTYRQLIGRQKAGSPEMTEAIDLAAGALFKRAESMKKKGDVAEAAEVFKSIEAEFPESKIADRGWFEAGVCKEDLGSTGEAAMIFEQLPVKFPKSTIAERAFLRSAENYKKADRLEDAARVYQSAAAAIKKAEFAIPSLSSASECYQKLGQFDKAGEMFTVIYRRYSSDPKTPQALYNAGLMFEKARLFPNAIDVYSTLAKNFPESEYAPEAFFSVGLCQEKRGNTAEVARVFSEFALKYSADRYKQVQALVKAGNAYYELKNFGEAEKSFLLAASVYEKFHKSSDIDVGDVAQAYFKTAQIYYEAFRKMKLDARSERAMKALVSEKTKALSEPAKYYAKAIELGVEEWTIRGTYMIGLGFVDMAEAVAEQRLFGNQTERIASKVKILSSLEKYYQKAQEYFYKNIEWAHAQNISGAYVDSSMDRFMEMMFRKGDIMEEVGRMLKDSPVPRSLSQEDQQAYRDVLVEKWLEALDAALPKYTEAVRAAKELGIAKSVWLDKALERIREIKPDAPELDVVITEWVPAPKAAATGGEDAAEQHTFAGLDSQTEREMRRIQNIIAMNIPVEDKVRQLARIEMDAKRNIELEKQRIKELKEQISRL